MKKIRLTFTLRFLFVLTALCAGIFCLYRYYFVGDEYLAKTIFKEYCIFADVKNGEVTYITVPGDLLGSNTNKAVALFSEQHQVTDTIVLMDCAVQPATLNALNQKKFKKLSFHQCDITQGSLPILDKFNFDELHLSSPIRLDDATLNDLNQLLNQKKLSLHFQFNSMSDEQISFIQKLEQHKNVKNIDIWIMDKKSTGFLKAKNLQSKIISVE